MPGLSPERLSRMRRHGSGFVSTLGLELAHAERMLAGDAARDWSNMRASLRTLALTVLVAVLMGAAAWAFLTSLDIVTGGFRVYRFSHTDGYINTNYSGTNFVYLALK